MKIKITLQSLGRNLILKLKTIAIKLAIFVTSWWTGVNKIKEIQMTEIFINDETEFYR